MECIKFRLLFYCPVISLLVFILCTDKIQAQVPSQLEFERTDILMPNELLYPAAPTFIGRAGFVMDSDGYIHIVDRGGEKPFVKINPVSGESISYGGWGEGPGEVSREGFQALSVVDDIIYVYDAFGFTLQQFDLNGEPIGYEVLESISMPGLFKVIDHETALFSPIMAVRTLTSEHWFRLYSKTDKGWEPEGGGLFRFDDHPDLLPVKINPAMGMGAIMKEDGIIYLSSLYSSLLAAIRPDGGILFKNYEPDNAKLPVEEIAQSGNRVSMDPTDPTFYSLDIALCSEHIYVLYSGEQFMNDDLYALFGGASGGTDEEIRPGEGKKVYVFSKSTGELLHYLDLDFYATAILATDENLFLVSWDDPIAIHVLKNTSR